MLASSGTSSGCRSSTSCLTLASDSTLSTPWPVAEHVDQLVAVGQHHGVAADHEVRRRDVGVDVLAEVLEHVAHRLELDAGVEQRLDHAQLEQVVVASSAAGSRSPWRRSSDGRMRSVRAQ